MTLAERFQPKQQPKVIIPEWRRRAELIAQKRGRWIAVKEIRPW